MIETGTITTFSIILLIFEHLCPLQCCKNKLYPGSENKRRLRRESTDYDQIMYDQSSIEIMKETARTERKQRLDLLNNIISTVRNNKDLKINSRLDEIIEEINQTENSLSKVKMKKRNSMPHLNFKYPDGTKGEDERKVHTFPSNSPVKVSTPIKQIQILKSQVSPFKRVDGSVQSLVLSDFMYDNVYAEKLSQAHYVAKVSEQIQTDIPQFTRNDIDCAQPYKQQRTLTNSKVDNEELKDQKESKFRGFTGFKKQYQYQQSFQTQKSRKDNEFLSEKGIHSYNYTLNEEEEDLYQLQKNLNKENSNLLNQSQEHFFEEENPIFLMGDQFKPELDHLEDQLEQTKEQLKLERKKSLEQEIFNQRSFNIHDIQGNLQRDKKNQLIQPLQTNDQNQYIDLDGRIINQKGYLLNEDTGDIINRYTFNKMFNKCDIDSYGEIPSPFKDEKFNFNPHEILGNFDYDRKVQKPVIFKNKNGRYVDKNLREVNSLGYLIDNQGNIVDNQGRIKFAKILLTDSGDLPQMLNNLNKKYVIKDIIGVFSKYSNTKEIKIRKNMEDKSILTDKLDRRVNEKGYLIDDKGNIINQLGKIVFRQNQLIYGEPPKIFQFQRKERMRKRDIDYIQQDELSGIHMISEIQNQSQSEYQNFQNRDIQNESQAYEQVDYLDKTYIEEDKDQSSFNLENSLYPIQNYENEYKLDRTPTQNTAKEIMRSKIYKKKPIDLPKYPQQRRPKSQVRKRPKPSTQFDFNKASDPLGYINQDKSKERLARFTNSISNQNSTQQLFFDKINMSKPDLHNNFAQSTNSPFDFKKIKKNPFILADHYQDGEIQFYEEYVDQPFSDTPSAIMDNSNRHFNPKQGNYLGDELSTNDVAYQRAQSQNRRQENYSFLEMNSNKGSENQRSKQRLMNKSFSRQKELEKIYLQKFPLPKSQKDDQAFVFHRKTNQKDYFGNFNK